MMGFRFPRPIFVAFAVLLAGCATATIEEAVPQATSSAGQNTSGPEKEIVADEAVDNPPGASAATTGKDGFPNLNATPQAQDRQLSEVEKSAAMEELKQAKASQDAQGSGAPDDTKRLRRIGKTHASDVLKKIEVE